MRNPKNQEVYRMVVLESPDSANVVAVTKDRKVVLVNQFRFGTRQNTLELPGGLLEQGEDQLEAIKRELREETGYTGGQWSYLGTIESNPVFMDSYLHHYLAVGVEKTTIADQDEEEYIKTIEVSIEELRDLVVSSKIQHPHAISGIVRVISLWDEILI